MNWNRYAAVEISLENIRDPLLTLNRIIKWFLIKNVFRVGNEKSIFCAIAFNIDDAGDYVHSWAAEDSVFDFALIKAWTISHK